MSGHARCLPEANLATVHSQPALSCDCQTNTIVQKVAVRAANINLNRLRSRSLSRRSLAVTLHAHSHGLAEPDGMDIQPS